MTVLSSGLSDVKIDSAVFSPHVKQPTGLSVGTEKKSESDMLGPFLDQMQ